MVNASLNKDSWRIIRLLMPLPSAPLLHVGNLLICVAKRRTNLRAPSGTHNRSSSIFPHDYNTAPLRVRNSFPSWSQILYCRLTPPAPRHDPNYYINYGKDKSPHSSVGKINDSGRCCKWHGKVVEVKRTNRKTSSVRREVMFMKMGKAWIGRVASYKLLGDAPLFWHYFLYLYRDLLKVLKCKLIIFETTQMTYFSRRSIKVRRKKNHYNNVLKGSI